MIHTFILGTCGLFVKFVIRGSWFSEVGLFFEGFCQCETDDFSSVDFCDRKIFGGDIMVMWVVCRHCWTRQLAFYPLPGFCYNCGGDLLPVRCGKFIILCA